MTLALALIVSILTVVTWGYLVDHRSELDWRRPDTGRGSAPRTDFNQQWTIVDR